MILGDAQASNGYRSGATFDDLFRRAVTHNPDGLALCDPPNRTQFTGDAPRRLTFTQADQMVCAIAAKLRQLTLSGDAIVGIQLPNTVESVLTLLGVLRAGMIAAPLPLLWRHSDLVHVLGRLGAKALITCNRVGAVEHAELARQVAADVFSIRYVCAFGGGEVPDGVVPFDDLYAEDQPGPLPQLERERSGNPAAHLAVITWDVTTDNLVPVARNHSELVAGGVAIVLEGRFPPGSTFVSALPLSSFAGISMTLMPWLLTAGTLLLHQPFDPEALAEQLAEGCAAAILPAPVVPRLCDAKYFGAHIGAVMGLWRSPERVASGMLWRERETGCIDIVAFGETCVIATKRGPSGKPAPIPVGGVTAPRGAPGAMQVAEVMRTPRRTIALGGPMVPRYPFPAGAALGTAPYFKTEEGVVDTGYPCQVNDAASTLIVTGPAAGIAGVGGYRFALRQLQQLITNVDSGGRITALPDSLSGHRLAGLAPDNAALRRALIHRGVNPLVADAFRP